MERTDRYLMDGIRRRDAAAFEQFLSRHRAPVRGRLLGIVRDAAAADDLTQDVFLRVWTRADQWRGQGSARAWLMRIATNIALNHLRAMRRRPHRPLLPPAHPEDEEEGLVPGWMVDSAMLGPDAALEAAERRERLHGLIAEMTEERREVLRLFYQEEMDVEGVARRLGIPPGTVKSRLHYARKALSRKWERTEGGDA
jgi:RNA polymerase sigma-70 factor (ECF subfamily)